MYKKWTNKECKKVIELINDGLTFRQISERFGVSRSAIAGVALRDKRKDENA